LQIGKRLAQFFNLTVCFFNFTGEGFLVTLHAF